MLKYVHVFQTTRSHIPKTVSLTAYRFKHKATALLAASYDSTNWDCIVSMLWAGQISNHGSILRKDKKFFPSSKNPDRL